MFDAVSASVLDPVFASYISVFVDAEVRIFFPCLNSWTGARGWRTALLIQILLRENSYNKREHLITFYNYQHCISLISARRHMYVFIAALYCLKFTNWLTFRVWDIILYLMSYSFRVDRQWGASLCMSHDELWWVWKIDILLYVCVLKLFISHSKFLLFSIYVFFC